jgi:quercetin dioxygenase-like cupin family protein
MAPAPFRRVLTAHRSTDTDGTDVHIHDDSIVPKTILDGNAHVRPLYSHMGCPTFTSHSIKSSAIDQAAAAVTDVTLPGGTNCQVTDVEPGYRTPMHRSSSVDYNIIIEGSVTLITPTREGEKRTLMKAGDIVIQRGTLHAWETSKEVGARWYTVVVSALPVKVGDKVDGVRLDDVSQLD